MPQRVAMDISLFLRHYQMYPCLWNRSHQEYRSRPQREAAEQALLPVSGLSSVRELRQKIRNIRCTYNQELAKIRRSINAGAAELYKPKLSWFGQADSFLRVNHMDCFEDSKTDLAYLSQSVLNGDYQYVKQEMSMDCSGGEQECVESSTRKDKEGDEDSTYAGHLKGYGSLAEFAETVESQSSAPNSNHSSPTGSEFCIFGQHVATQLQQLPLEEAIRLEEEIQSVITRARLRSLQNE